MSAAAGAVAQEFRQDINGLRAWAVMAVVLYHFGVAGISGGFAGVDVFFVLSGFVIFHAVRGRQHLGAGWFLRQRFWRIRADALIPRELDPWLPTGVRTLGRFLRLLREHLGRLQLAAPVAALRLSPLATRTSPTAACRWAEASRSTFDGSSFGRLPAMPRSIQARLRLRPSRCTNCGSV